MIRFNPQGYALTKTIAKIQEQQEYSKNRIHVLQHKSIMKKLTTIIALLLASVTNAQEPDVFFNVNDFNADVAAWNTTFDNAQSVTQRAKELSKLGHMTDDKAIQWQYVIRANDTIDSEQFVDVAERWVKKMFPSEKSVKTFNEKEMEFTWRSKLIHYSTDFNFTLIHGDFELKIEIKEDRFRITGIVRHYVMSTMSKTMEFYSPGSMYPFYSTKNKQSLSRAYINANSEASNVIKDFLNYLNQNYNHINHKIETEEDW